MKLVPYSMMTMISRRTIFAAAAALAACKNVEPPSEIPAHLLAYEGVGTNHVDIFNFEAGIATHVGREFFRTHKWQSEFGGPIKFCSNESFHCLDAGLHLAVPKQRIAGEWSFAGIACKLRERGADGRTLRMLCRTQSDSAVDFTYSQEKGVTSYRMFCPDCDDTTYRLVGQQGLFSNAFDAMKFDGHNT